MLTEFPPLIQHFAETRDLFADAVTALGRLSALGCLAAAPALAQSDDELLGYAPRARPPEGYPAAYAVTVRAAEDEGQLSIHSTTDERVAMPLVADFRRLYPRIAVTYEDLGSTELYHRFIAENQLGREAADVLWSSAMDHMVALATAGHARATLAAANRATATITRPPIAVLEKPITNAPTTRTSHAATLSVARSVTRQCPR